MVPSFSVTVFLTSPNVFSDRGTRVLSSALDNLEKRVFVMSGDLKARSSPFNCSIVPALETAFSNGVFIKSGSLLDLISSDKTERSSSSTSVSPLSFLPSLVKPIPVVSSIFLSKLLTLDLNALPRFSKDKPLVIFLFSMLSFSLIDLNNPTDSSGLEPTRSCSSLIADMLIPVKDIRSTFLPSGPTLGPRFLWTS